MKIKYTFLLVLLMSSIGFTLGQSQIGNDIDGERASDNSGWRTAISGDGNTVIIGAPKNYGSQVQGTSPGHVRVYKKVSGKWMQKGSDIDGSGNECFGATVAISRNAEIIAVGAPCVGSGVVRIYQFSSAKWTQIGKDIKGEALSDYFGCSVSLSDSGNRIAVGAYGNDGTSTFTGDQRGHVRVFENKNGDWSQLGADIDGVAGGDFSGTDISLSGNGSILAIGSPDNDENGKGSGQVRVFEHVGASWKQKGKAINGKAIADRFGYSLSLNFLGNKLAVGAPNSDAPGGVVYGDFGQIRVYSFADSVWNQIGSEINGIKTNDNFGWSVALSKEGDVFVAGAPNNDSAGIDAGHVRVYKWDSNNWTQVKNDINGESAGDQFGNSVSVSSSGSTFAVGAPYNDGVGSNGGHVRVYVTCNIKYTTDSIVACKSHKWTNGVVYTSNNNTATDTFINVEGCDSIVTLKLTIKQHSKSSVSQTACDVFLSPTKKAWTKTGNYADTIRNWCGCDSTISYSLTITKIDSLISQQPLDQTVQTNGDARFITKSFYQNAKYQWQSDIGFGFVNLSNASFYSNVNGDTLKVTSVSQSNNMQLFRCLVARSGCFDTTQNAVLKVSSLSKTQQVVQNDFSIYPSPTNGRLHISISENLLGSMITIMDVNGKVVNQRTVYELNSSFDLANLKDGIYIFKLGQFNQHFRLNR
jgi:hypothetical protein